MTCDVSRRYRRSHVAVRNERQNGEALGGGGPAGCGVTGGLPWRAPVTALVWALTAAVLYGTGAALQQRQAAAAPSQAAGRPRLLLLLVRRPWWLLGIGVEFGGFATHAVALRTGPLTIVQMLVASSLLFSVATVRLWSGRRLSWITWAAVLAVIVGIASFVVLASPAGGVPGVSGHAGLAAACLATCAVPLAAAGLAAVGRRRALLLAVAAGLADAGIAVVTMAFSHVVSGGLTGMAGSWATYALMLGGPCSLLLTQTAYQAGRPMITLPVIAVVTPVASLAAGNLLLGESAQLGVLSGAVAALAVLVTLAGLVVLARLTTGQSGPVSDQGSSVTLPAFPASGSRHPWVSQGVGYREGTGPAVAR
jgi:drug/metabolite transporter (DMT)-like permease